MIHHQQSGSRRKGISGEFRAALSHLLITLLFPVSTDLWLQPRHGTEAPWYSQRWLYEMRTLVSKYIKPGCLTLQPSENSGTQDKWCFLRHLVPWAGERVTGTHLAILPSLSSLLTDPNFYLKIHFPVGWPWGMGWGGRWEGSSGWGTLVHLWLIHVNVW